MEVRERGEGGASFRTASVQSRAGKNLRVNSAGYFQSTPPEAGALAASKADRVISMRNLSV